MKRVKPKEKLAKLRKKIGETTHRLRRARHLRQADLAAELGISQGRLSEIERGDGSFTAEQFLVLLGVFNVSASDFSSMKQAPENEVQNALARLGATELYANGETLPAARHDRVVEVVREALAGGAPRHLVALGPVLVRQVDDLNLQTLRLAVGPGLERRLAWLLDNIRAGIVLERLRTPRNWATRARRAEFLFETYLDEPARERMRRESGPDLLDATITSKRTWVEVQKASSEISQHWHVVTVLQPADFAEALRAAYEAR